MRDPSRQIIVTNFAAAVVLLTALAAVPAFPQTFAVVAPDNNVRGNAFASAFAKALSSRVTVLDLSLSDSAFRSVPSEDPYNLTAEAARNIGSSIGCRFYVILKTGLQRRSSSERHEFYEAYAVFYLVSSLTGRLSDWSIMKFEEDTPETAEKNLMNSFASKAGELVELALAAERSEAVADQYAEIQDASDADDATRPPLPFKRIKPEYTKLADYYNVAATVDIEVYFSAEGRILRTSVVRWAGYGLDESVDRTIREMQWRAADRKGQTLPMRVLLRYNFRDIENEQN